MAQIGELGKQITQRERRLAVLQDQNKKLRDQLAMLRLPAVLDRRVRELNLGLTLPQPSQILRLPEPAPLEPTDPAAPRQFAAGGTDSFAMP